MAFMPSAEYTITASGVWNSSPGFKHQENPKGLIPIIIRVTLKVSTSAWARKLPE